GTLQIANSPLRCYPASDSSLRRDSPSPLKRTKFTKFQDSNLGFMGVIINRLIHEIQNQRVVERYLRRQATLILLPT
ncbi:MAG: hypothetical protein ACYT04_71260, partial [Nostoc sp.]